MIRLFLLSIVCGCVGVVARVAHAVPQPSLGLLEFMRSQGTRRYQQVPHEVLAFYYTWYGRPERHGRWVHWGKVNEAAHESSETTHYPALGAYDSQDPALLDAHIDEAKAHGVTAFIATWWGQRGYEDRAFQILLDRAEKKDFKVTVYWETAPGKGQPQIARAIEDLAYLVKNYGARKAFLKVDGKPVIFVYGRVMSEVPLSSWPAIITGTREQVGDFLLIADGYQEQYARLFDGIHTYNICGEVKGKTPEQLRTFSADSFRGAVGLAKRHARLSCLTIIPGYDDTKIRKPGLKAERREGQTYRVLWEEAMKADPDWILITSWNELHEGSEIEPTFEDGDKYLRLTGEYAPRFLSARFSKAQVSASASIVTPAQARKLQQLYHGRTIGLLPDYGGLVPIWLLDAGLKVKELTWADLLDPAILNPGNIPLLLHAGGEYYLTSVRTERDVEKALQRYLVADGFLMSIPFQPLPFNYDINTRRVAPIANKLGLPIAQGWERPPEGAVLTFHMNQQALPGLPATAAFPATGDLRWRPATRSLAGKEDFYLSLADLTDANGQSYGDAIAYIEHKTPPLTRGKTLYAWMRMPDLPGMDQALFALFRFAGERLAGSK